MGLIAPLSPVLGGEGVGGEGAESRRASPPHPNPLSPEYRGEGLEVAMRNSKRLHLPKRMTPLQPRAFTLIELLAGGVQFLFGDGGVRLVTFDVDANPLAALMTPDGGEEVVPP
jgi:hypothetical protein